MSAPTIRAVFPFEPVAWGRVRVGRYGQSYVPPRTRQFKKCVAQFAEQFRQCPLLDHPLKVSLRFVMKRPKKPKFNQPAVTPDIDNLQKGIFDALNGVLWTDDARICSIDACKVYDMTGGSPRIEMTVEVLE